MARESREKGEPAVVVELAIRCRDGSYLEHIGLRELPALPVREDTIDWNGEVYVVEAVGPADAESTVEHAVCLRRATTHERLLFRARQGLATTERVLRGETVAADASAEALRDIDAFARYEARQIRTLRAMSRADPQWVLRQLIERARKRQPKSNR